MVTAVSSHTGFVPSHFQRFHGSFCSSVTNLSSKLFCGVFRNITESISVGDLWMCGGGFFSPLEAPNFSHWWFGGGLSAFMHRMAEEILNDSFPDLKELENKTGRKIPETLLMWMRDAADCEDGWRSDVVDSSSFSDSFSDKINSLKQEMRWLRSADVRILRQLVAVHEGIEAMRWLMEERGALTSRGSSLTGSLSSLVTVEDQGPSMSPYRQSPSPSCPQDLTETTHEESAHQRLPPADCGDSNMLTSDSSEARPLSPSRFTHGSRDQSSFSPANNLVSAIMPKSQPQDSDAALLKDIKDGANIIRKALLRSNKTRGELKVDPGSSALSQQSGERYKVHQTQESFTASQTNTMEEEENTSSKEKLLLGYDAQWCWVESQDDVTFL